MKIEPSCLRHPINTGTASTFLHGEQDESVDDDPI